MAGAVDGNGRTAFQLGKICDQIALVLRSFLRRIHQVELHAEGLFRKFTLRAGISAEYCLAGTAYFLIHDLDIGFSVGRSKGIAGHVIKAAPLAAFRDGPSCIAARSGCIAGELHIGPAQPCCQGLAPLAEGIDAVLYAYIPDKAGCGINGLIVFDGHSISRQIPVAAKHVGGHGQLVPGIIDHNAAAVFQQ